MAIKHFCDRCWQEVGVGALVDLTVPPLANAEAPAKKVGLCQACLRALHEWVKPLPEEYRR